MRILFNIFKEIALLMMHSGINIIGRLVYQSENAMSKHKRPVYCQIDMRSLGILVASFSEDNTVMRGGSLQITSA